MEPWVLVLLTATFVVLVPCLLLRCDLVQRKLACPERGMTATVELFQRHGKMEKPVRIRACSLLPHPRRIDCDQACIRRPA